MNRIRVGFFLSVLAVVMFTWSCGDDGWCTNANFLNQAACEFAGHEWQEPEESAGCQVGDVVVEGQSAGDCQDGADNDRDTLFDCDDDGCAGAPGCAGNGDDDTEPAGDDDTSGGDDDTVPTGDDDDTVPTGDDDTSGGGAGDDDGTGTPGGGGGSESGPDCQPTSCPNCEDGVDNDGDGSIDCDDEDCAQWCGNGGGNGGGGGSESGSDCTPASCPNCVDGIDNDGDGDIDCADADCSDYCGQ